MRARFPPETNTPIHNHGTWGVVAVYAGKDRMQEYRRLDSGEGEGHAEIELSAEHILGPGDTAIIPHPPQDIHAQQGADGEVALEFVLFGKNAMEIPRLYFDPGGENGALPPVAARLSGGGGGNLTPRPPSRRGRG